MNCYWSRGNGWAIGALCRVLDYLPATDAHRAEYVQIIQQMAVSLKAIQRTDGFWNVDLGDSADYPGPEESGTGFFTYAMAWGINHGILDTATYLPVVAKGWNAMVDSCIHPMTDTIILGYVQGSGSEPSSAQPVTYNKQPDFDDYGVGIFLLAGSEVYKLVPSPPTATQRTAARPGSQPQAYLRNNVVHLAQNLRTDVGVALFDVNGQAVFMKRYSGTAEIRFPSTLRGGVYLVRVTGAGATLLERKIVIAR